MRSSSPLKRGLLPSAAILALLMLSVPALSPATAATTEWYDWPMRGQISIGDDGAFSVQNGVSGGTGTSGDPYIIENWRIWNETGVTCISITNTEAYFVIRNVYAKTDSTGIYLYNVVHGRVADSIVTDSPIGISLSYSEKCSIVNCTLSRNSYGIVLTECKDITVRDNGYHDNVIDKLVNKDEKMWIVGSWGSLACASVLIVLIAVLALIAWGKITYKPPRNDGESPET